jgi:hypothetical protein
MADFEDVEEFVQDCRRNGEEAADTIKSAQARMAKYFDSKHTPIKEADQVWLKLAKGTDIGYRLPNMSALDVKKIGPFPVKRRMGKVAFELDLPEHLNIHPVISCVHLEPARPEHFDRLPPPPPLVVDGEERYVIDRILKKEQRRQLVDKSATPTTGCAGKDTAPKITRGLKPMNFTSKFQNSLLISSGF